MTSRLAFSPLTNAELGKRYEEAKQHAAHALMSVTRFHEKHGTDDRISTQDTRWLLEVGRVADELGHAWNRR